MTETQSPPDGPSGSEQQSPEPGVAKENLRDYERLRRSIADRKIAGVAGGLGRHLNIDPTVLRVIFVVLVFFGGAGIVLYGAAWLVVPEEGTEDAVVNAKPATRNALLFGAAVLAALLLLGDMWGGWGGPFPLPLAILAIILVVVVATRAKPGSDQPAPPEGYYPPPSSPTSPPTEAQWLGASDTTPSGATAVAPPTGPPTWTTPTTPYRPPPPKSDRGPKLFGFTLAFIAVALGTLGLYEASGGEVADAAYAALALTVIGVMLLVGSVAGRPGGLIFLGVVATLALMVTATVDRYGYNRPDSLSVSPPTSSTLADGYSMLAGKMSVDLTTIEDLEGLDGRTLTLRAEAGEIRVFVPDGIDVRVDARIGFGGDITVDGQQDGGGNPQLVSIIDGGENVPELDLDVDLRVGSIDVRQLQVTTTQEGDQL